MAVPIRLAPEVARRRLGAARALTAGSSLRPTMADTLVRIDRSLPQAIRRRRQIVVTRLEVEDLT